MPSPPALTDEQRKAALEKAAASRRQRAEIKDKLKNGSVTFSDLCKQAESGDEVVGKMKVLAVLESLPRVGKVRARQLLESASVADTRRVQGLGKNQRKTLEDKLSES